MTKAPLLTIFSTLILLATQLQAAKPCRSGMIGYWPLDGDGTEVVNALPGTLVGNVDFVPGVAGQAASLGGDGSYVDAGTQAVLTDFGGNQMSVTAWVWRTVPPGPGGDGLGAVITARTFCNAGNYQFYGHLFSEEVYFSKWDDVFFEDQVSSSITIPSGQWVHIAATYGTDAVRFYVDGALAETVFLAPPSFQGGLIKSTVENTQIGWDSCSSYWTGLLDEVAVFNVTLTDAEVSRIHRNGLAGRSLCGKQDRDEDSDGDSDTDSDSDSDSSSDDDSDSDSES